MLSRIPLLFLLWWMPFLATAAETEFGDKELIHLVHDQPMYFLFGAPEVKAQLSFKVKVLSQADLYVAYTQKIFWDIFEKSSPFRDINYNPSLFYRFDLGGKSEKLLDLIGWEHESNGKGDGTSRSWDRVGLRFQSLHTFENGSKLVFGARAWVPFNLDQPNPDIAQYRGLYEITITYANFMSDYFDLNDLTLRFYPGGATYLNPLQGGRELTFRLNGKSSAFLTNAVFQIFQGYGENMLEYNHSVWGFRAGFGI